MLVRLASEAGQANQPLTHEKHMNIEQVTMTRPHFQRMSERSIRMVVLHATAGRAPGDLAWLRRGGDERRPVSVHYYIDKAGRISQLVADEDIAWHAGKSSWVVDGRQISNCNTVSLGIELENLNNGRDPYPEAQYEAAIWLTRRLVEQYDVPREQLVRHLDISPGRKTDPAGFPWEEFVYEVYAGISDPTAVATTPHLRTLLQEAAYRAAGSAAPRDWPLATAAAAAQAGMPVAMLTSRPARIGGSAPADAERNLYLPGQPPLIVEIYARDLFYGEATALADGDVAPSDVRRLHETRDATLRAALLELQFRSADPVNGLRPDWAFHQFYLEHMRELGVPISPNLRLAKAAGDGRQYVCQHFAFDSLCAPVGEWRTIYRLSTLRRGEVRGLTPELAAELQQLLLDDLYRRRTGHRYAEDALFSRYALERGLGAPLGRATFVQRADMRIWMQPFAADVLYCRLPADHPRDAALPAGARIGRMSDLDRVASTAVLLNDLLSDPTPDASSAVANGDRLYVAGTLASLPPLADVSLHLGNCLARDGAAVECVVLYPVVGPPHTDLATAGQPFAPGWHYYIDQRGAVLRLIPEEYAAYAAGATGGAAAQDLDRRSLAVAVEGGVDPHNRAQARSLAWLLTTTRQRLGYGRVYVAAGDGELVANR